MVLEPKRLGIPSTLDFRLRACRRQRTPRFAERVYQLFDREMSAKGQPRPCGISYNRFSIGPTPVFQSVRRDSLTRSIIGVVKS
jgi:hypothetical protein